FDPWRDDAARYDGDDSNGDHTGFVGAVGESLEPRRVPQQQRPVESGDERPKAHKTYTPKPLVKMFLNLNIQGLLTPRILASVASAFLPLTIQRLSRHTDRISKAARVKYEWIRPTLQALLTSLEKLPEMQEYVPPLREIVTGGPDSPRMRSFGTWFITSMKAFAALPFEKRMPVLLNAAPRWMTVVTSLMGFQFDKHDIPVMSKSELTH
ncbi:hypothetical protein FOZ62_015485, partial [Perkinsus olseni]